MSAHPDGRPVGTPADRMTRWLRRKAHQAFDPLWQRGPMSRIGAYEWLCLKTGIPSDNCHMGKMNADQCRLVIQVCKERK